MELSVLLAYIVVAVISIHVMCVVVLAAKHKNHQRKTRRDDDDDCLAHAHALPPGPLGLPLIGNALYFFVALRHNPHRALARLAEKYGPVVSFRPGMAASLFVVVSSPAAACEALAKNDLAVAGRYVPDNARALGHHAGSVFFLPSSSPLWKQHRTTIGTHMSSARGLGMTRHIRERHARQIAELVRAHSAGQQQQPPMAMALGEAMYGPMVNAVSNMLSSRNLADMSMEHEKGGQLHKKKAIARAFTEELGALNISDAFPFLAALDLFGSRRRTSRIMAKLYKVFDQEVESRLASGTTEHGDDLLGVVLARHYAKSEITRADICKLLADLLIAGAETTKVAVEWAMLRLLRHPDKMEKVRAELAASLGSKEFVEESDLDKLPYLHAVVKEVLRLHPSVPLMPREVVAQQGMSLGGFCVPKGTCVLVNLWALGRDPASWPEPEEFVPERFLAAAAGDRPAVVSFRGGSDFSYIPFGAGRRVCPGMDMAARFVPLVLASILHKVEWKLPDAAMAPEDVDLSDDGSVTLEPTTPLRAIPLFTP